jgi:hypothetical protein
MVQSPKSKVTMTAENRRSMNLACEEWSRILFRYRGAVRTYSLAACAMGAAGTTEFDTAWERSEEARKVCERFRTALLEHEHRHGCQVLPEPVQEIPLSVDAGQAGDRLMSRADARR